MLKIEKNIPIPSREYGRNGSPKTKYPFREMEIGDSFYVSAIGKGETQAISRNILNSASSYNKKHKRKKFTTRIVAGGIRCWRIE